MKIDEPRSNPAQPLGGGLASAFATRDALAMTLMSRDAAWGHNVDS